VFESCIVVEFEVFVVLWKFKNITKICENPCNPWENKICRKLKAKYLKFKNIKQAFMKICTMWQRKICAISKISESKIHK